MAFVGKIIISFNNDLLRFLNISAIRWLNVKLLIILILVELNINALTNS
jgi:hypothetical protein